MTAETATVTSLHIYPVKGCRGYSVQEAHVTTQGIAGDRVFTVMLDGHRTNQKDIADLKYLSAVWQGGNLELNFPGLPALTVNPAAGQPSGAESFRGSSLPLLDMGDEVASWLRQAFHVDVRLVRQADKQPWVIPLPEFGSVHGAEQDRYVDAAPLLLTNLSSLRELNARLPDPVPMDRFRPNMVVDGLAAYGEEQVQHYEFASLQVRSVTVCERCIVTTMNQQTGEMGKEPLRTLSGYHRRANDYAGGIMFGMYVTATGDGSLKVGEQARLTAGQPFTADRVSG